MGIFDAFKKKENDEPASFVLGVEDRFALLNTKDIVVVGYVKGTVRVGAAVYVTNFSDDEEGEILLTTVLGIELEPGKGQMSQGLSCGIKAGVRGRFSVSMWYCALFETGKRIRCS